jgi:hypothetical protein
MKTKHQETLLWKWEREEVHSKFYNIKFSNVTSSPQNEAEDASQNKNPKPKRMRKDVLNLKMIKIN